MPGFDFPDSAQGALDAIEGYFERGWTDGLPVVPPTRGAVEAMLATVDRPADEDLGEVPPRLGVATVEAVAVNAVMAGCKPAYFPVVLAAVEAVLEPAFNLNGVQATTNAVAPLVIVTGPVVDELGFNYGFNCFGQGNRANATVGRAVRLVMTNLGAGHPGTGDKSTMGQPAKYSFCVAESPHTPWTPLHVERGLAADESAVTVMAANYHIFLGGGGRGPSDEEIVEDTLRAYADAVKYIEGDFLLQFGGQVGLVFNPYKAELLAAQGWDKARIKRELFERARVPLPETLATRGEDEEKVPAEFRDAPPGTPFPLVRKPENYHIIVAGDAYASFAALLVGWGYMGGYAQTKAIRRGG